MAVVAELAPETLLSVKEESWLAIVWRRLIKHKLAITGMAIMGLMIAIVVVVPFFTPGDGKPPVAGFLHDPFAQNLADRNALPSFTHWMGTDDLGRDVLTRLIFAGRISLFLAFTVVFFQETFGALVGAASNSASSRARQSDFILSTSPAVTTPSAISFLL